MITLEQLKGWEFGAVHEYKLMPWDFELREAVDTLTASLKVVEAAVSIEDVLEVPSNLGASSRIIIQRKIEEFREALKPFQKESAGRDTPKEIK